MSFTLGYFTTTCLSVLNKPQAPYFGPIGRSTDPTTGMPVWTASSGGYSAVWARAGAGVIDAFLVQFYNQVGSVQFEVCGIILPCCPVSSGGLLSGSSLFIFHSPLCSQGWGCYITYNGTFADSYAGGTCLPGTAVSQIASYGVPMKSIVVGKYLIDGVDASNGYVAPATLHSWYDTATAQYGFNSGFMIWQWSASQAPAWAAAV